MDINKLRKIQQTLNSYRGRGGIKPAELEHIAKELGRERSNRGSEPTFINLQFPSLHPLSIPHHGARDLNKYTAKNILDQLQHYIDEWQNFI
jgi:hypothetical protein